MSSVNRKTKIGRRDPGASAQPSQVLQQLSANRPLGNTVSIYGNTVSERISGMLNLEDTSTVFIPFEKIYPNPLNKPYMEDITGKEIDALKASILSHGLMHNLVVIQDNIGGYRLISGEKRWTAIKSMTINEREEKFPKGIEAKVIPFNSELDKDDEHIMLLTCNVLVFSSGSPDARQLRDLLKLYDKKGFDRKDLVEYLGVYLESSERHIYRLLQESRAIKPFLDMYDHKKMTRTALQSFGSLDVLDQEKLFEKIKRENVEFIDETLANELKKQFKEAKKANQKEVQEKSTSMLKFEKSLDSIDSSIAKMRKQKTKGLTASEKEMLRVKTSLIISKIKEFESEISEL